LKQPERSVEEVGCGQDTVDEPEPGSLELTPREDQLQRGLSTDVTG
jgi:hypothetical protein